MSDNIELDLTNLARVKRTYFSHGQAIGKIALATLRSDFYQALDLSARAIAWSNVDAQAVGVMLPLACALARRQRPGATLRLLVIGCGDGRQLEDYLCVARAHGVVHITFNDYLAFHTARVAEKVQALPPEQTADLEWAFVSGDFSELDLHATFDVVIATYFVTAEIIDLAGTQALRACRARFFTNVVRHLSADGIFLEDTPNADDPGFYSYLRGRSAAILAQDCIFMEEVGNISLACVETKTGNAGYVRYIPTRAAHIAEMSSAGLSLAYSEVHTASLAEGHALPRHKYIDLWRRT